MRSIDTKKDALSFVEVKY